MTAFDGYYQAIQDGKLPATVPIRNENDSVGIATMHVTWDETDDGRNLVLSSSDLDRSVAAIYACMAAVEQVERRYDGIKPLADA